MPALARWSDFEAMALCVKRIKRGDDEHDVPMARFSCPYCAVDLETPAIDALRKKSILAQRHLNVCNGVSADGRRAEGDARRRKSPGDKSGSAVASCDGLEARVKALEAKLTALDALPTTVSTLHRRVAKLAAATAA